MKSETRVWFSVLMSVPFVMVTSNSLLIPLLPSLQENLRVGLFEVGLIITAFSIPAGLTIPLAGYLSDLWGRKKIMVPALILFGSGGLVAGLAAMVMEDPYYVILGGRVLQGIGGGGTYQIAMALAGDVFQSQERSKVLGLLEAANGVGKVVSPILGSALALVLWYLPFFLYPVLGYLSGFGVLRFVKEPKRERMVSWAEKKQALKETFRDKGKALMVLAFNGFLILFFLFGILSFYSDVLEKTYHLGQFVRGLVVAIPVGLMALTSWLTGTFLQERIAKILKILIVLGLFMIAISLFLVSFVRELYLLLLVVSILGVGSGLVLPAINLLVTSAIGQAERGTIVSLYGSVRFFGAALGPPAFGLAVSCLQLWSFIGGGMVISAIFLTALIVNQSQLLPDKLQS